MATAQLTFKKRGPKPGTGDFIKAHLQHVGEDYIYNSYRIFCKFLQAAGQRNGSYESFRKYWNVCAQMGLIEFSREEPAKATYVFNRRYYRIVKRNLYSKNWGDPRAALDVKEGRVVQHPDTGELKAKSQLGRRRYRQWVKHVPPKAIGRPRKPMGMDFEPQE